MKHILFGVLAISLITIISSCGNAEYERTSDGLIHRIIRLGKGDLVKPGNLLKIHQEASIGDSLIFSSFGKVPVYGSYDSLSQPSHDFLDILHKMSVGDSAIVIRSVDTLAKRGVLSYNSAFKKGTTIKVIIKVLGIFESQEALENDRLKEAEKYKQDEIAALEKFVNKQGLANTIKTPEGVIVAIEKEGSGVQIDSGMNVKVNYTGQLLDGTVFDSNQDSTFGHTEPFSFIANQRQVIEGWDIGVQNLKVGSKAKIFIPSMLGYGIQGSGPKLPPYSNLIFDIEVIEANFSDSLLNR